MAEMGGVDEEFVVDERFPRAAGTAGLQTCMVAASEP